MPRSNHAFAIPRPVRYEFDRTRLLDRIGKNNAPLALVIAPAGYGKSVLLAQYARRHRLAAWVTISQESTDVQTLALSLARSAQLKYNLTTPRFFTSLREGRGADKLASSLSRDVDALEESLTFVIDGLENLSDDAANWLSTLVDRLIPAHHFILAGRIDKGFGARKGTNVARVAADELAFNLAEARVLFGLAGKTLPAEQVLRQAGGWPVALKLVASGGSADEVGLIDRPLEVLPPLLKEGLTDLSVLSTWSDEDASALGLELPDGWLDTLSTSGLPLALLDESSCRPHDLLRTALLERLKHDPARYALRQRDAATLYLDREEPINAIRAALEAGDHERAVGWVREAVFGWGMRWEWTTVREQLLAFPRHALPPDLRTYLGASLSQTGGIAEGETILRGVVQEGHADALTYVSLGMGAMGRGDFVSAQRCADAGLPLARAPFESAFLYQLKGLSLIGHDWVAAGDAGEEALRHAQAVGHPALLSGAITTKVYAGLGIERRNPYEYSTFYQRARVELEHAVDLVRSEGFFNQMFSAVTLLAHLDFQVGESERSVRLIDEVAARAEQHPNALPYMYMRRGDHNQAKLDFVKAVENYEQGFAISERLNPGVLHLFAFSLCEVWRYLGRLDTAREWLLNAVRPVVNDGSELLPNPNHHYFQGIFALDEGDGGRAEHALQTYTAQATRVTEYLHRIVLAHAYLAEIARREGRLTKSLIDALQNATLRYRAVWALQREARYLRPLYEECIARGWYPELFATPGRQAVPVLSVRTLGVPVAHLGNERLELPPKTLDVLVYLALNNPCPTSEIIEAVWAPIDQVKANVRAHIHTIRKAFTDVTNEGNAFIRYNARHRLYELSVATDIDALNLEKALFGSQREKERAVQRYELDFMLALKTEWARQLRGRYRELKDKLITELSK